MSRWMQLAAPVAAAGMTLYGSYLFARNTFMVDEKKIQLTDKAGSPVPLSPELSRIGNAVSICSFDCSVIMCMPYIQFSVVTVETYWQYVDKA